MKKLVSVLTAVTMMFGMSASVSAFTLDLPENVELASTSGFNPDADYTMAYREKGTRADTVYISADDLKNGDYVFKASLILDAQNEGAYKALEQADMVAGRWDAYSEDGKLTKYITTGNVSTYVRRYSDDRTYEIYQEVENSMAKTPYQSSPRGTPYSAGPYKAYIVTPNKDNPDFKDKKTGEPVIYDLTYDDKTGVATAVIPKIDSHDYVLTITHYDPETPYGERFVGEITHMNPYIGTGFYNYYKGTNGEIGSFDVTVNKDIPDGIYYIAFPIIDRSKQTTAYLRNSSYSHNDNTGIIGHGAIPSNVYTTYNTETLERYDHNDPAYWLKIVVGSGNEESEGQAYDVNGDGNIDVSDATEELRLYAEAAVNADAQIYKSADGRTHSIANATAMLRYYAESAAGLR